MLTSAACAVPPIRTARASTAAENGFLMASSLWSLPRIVRETVGTAIPITGAGEFVYQITVTARGVAPGLAA